VEKLYQTHNGILELRKLYERRYAEEDAKKKEIVKKIMTLDNSSFTTILDVLNEELQKIEDFMAFSQAKIKETHQKEPKILSTLKHLRLEPRKWGLRLSTRLTMKAWEQSFDFHAKIGQLLDALDRKDGAEINRNLRQLGVRIQADYSLTTRGARRNSITIELDPSGMAGLPTKSYEPYDVPSETQE
jgi:hypothetical protein